MVTMDTANYMWSIAGIFLFSTICCAQDSGTPCSNPLGGTRIFVNDVPEDKPVGSVVAHLTITGDSNTIKLEQITTNSPFQFDPVSRNLTVRESLTNGQTSSKIVIQCTIIQMSQTVEFQVIVTILDLNNNAPQFQDIPYRANISELTPVGTTVFTGITATDTDPSNEYISYEVLPGPYSDFFSIPVPAQGSLVLKKMLDYEQIKTLTLTIVAKDHSFVQNQPQPTLNSTTEITVHVQDGDDQNPEFTSQVYIGTVKENDLKGTVINVKISAHDLDVSVNSPINYTIVQSTQDNDGQYFNVNPDTGVLSLARDGLMRGLQLAFLVRATKVLNPARYSQALVQIGVKPANENPPHFIQKLYNVTMVENVPAGSHVVTVTAFDNDQVAVDLGSPVINKITEGTVLVYSLEDNLQEFTIDSSTGSITTTRELNYEQTHQYELKVMVTDGTNTDNCVVMVTLININNNNPVFKSNTYIFGGVREVGYKVGTVKAEDADTASLLTYSFAVKESYFTIDEMTGEIQVTGKPDDLSDSVYVLYVVAMDEGIPPRMGGARVSVTFEPISAPVTEGGQSNMIVVIILAVLLALLLVVIVILAIFLYRKCYLTSHKVPPYCLKDMDDDLTFSSNCGTENSGVTLISYVSSKVSGKLPEYSEVHQQNANAKSNNKRCVRSRSFEQSIDFSRKDYTSYLDPPKGLAYKPSTKHHLDLYNNVGRDDDGTSPAENPFSSQDSTLDRPIETNTQADIYNDSLYAHHSATDIDFPTDSSGHVKIPPPKLYARPQKRVQPLSGATSSSSSVTQNGVIISNPNVINNHPNNIVYPDSSQSNNYMTSYEQPVSGFSNFGYDRNIQQPYDDDSVLRYKEQNYMHGQMEGDISPRSSIESDDHYNGDLTSFKGGSTTRLVGAPSKSKSRGSSNKGSGNISFVDTVDVSPPPSLYSSITSQRSGTDSNMNTHQSDDGRPGITVYY